MQYARLGLGKKHEHLYLIDEDNNIVAHSCWGVEYPEQCTARFCKIGESFPAWSRAKKFGDLSKAPKFVQEALKDALYWATLKQVDIAAELREEEASNGRN